MRFVVGQAERNGIVAFPSFDFCEIEISDIAVLV